MLLAVAALSSCVDDDKLLYSFEKPASIEGYEYLADYGALKTYVNRDATPNFKVGGALAAVDYNADGLVTRLANSNFDEIVAGNAMKMASCVNDKGEMDFSTVDAFVSNADENGINVYGHTLAWHAQQPKKWLEKLIKDKELDIDPVSAAMNGGEDYRLLYTVPIAQFEQFRKDFQAFDIIGHLAQPEAGAVLVSPDGLEHPVSAQGWTSLNTQ